MPSEPLFDLAGIDLDGVLLSTKQVEAINPHRGAMRQLDRVIWLDDAHSMAVGAKDVTEDEFWVPGHIPGRPLMPGVMMIEAGAQLASVLFRHRVNDNRFVGFTRCDDAVFRHQVVPGDTLYLLAKEVEFKPRRFISRAQGIVNGTIAFEATVTGMAMDVMDGAKAAVAVPRTS